MPARRAPWLALPSRGARARWVGAVPLLSDPKPTTLVPPPSSFANGAADCAAADCAAGAAAAAAAATAAAAAALASHSTGNPAEAASAIS